MKDSLKMNIVTSLTTIVCFLGLFFLYYISLFFHADSIFIAIFGILWAAGVISISILILRFSNNLLLQGKNRQIAGIMLLSYYVWIIAYGLDILWIDNLLIDNMLINLLCVVVFWAGVLVSFFIMRLLCRFVLNLEIEATMKQIELDFIKHQLNPHILFNHLNNIAATIMYDSKMALDYTYKLSEFLRFQLDISQKKTISIQEEVFFVQCYIDIEKLRLGDQGILYLHSHIENANYQIPPLLFYPLIELAIKKNYAYSVPSYIDINITADSNQISLIIRHAIPEQITNSTENSQKKKEIDDRLEVLCSQKLFLTITNNEGVETTELKIDLAAT